MIKNNKELGKMKREMWKKAYEKLIAWYRDLDPSVFSRFLQEKAALKERNDIIYFDIIGRIRERAKELGYYTETIRSDGSCLIAFLLGAVDDNPLKPYFYCDENGWVQYSTSKKFTKKTTKTVKVKKSSKKTTIKKQKKGKKYFVRVRTYKIVNGKKIYSDWSTVKNVKVK